MQITPLFIRVIAKLIDLLVIFMIQLLIFALFTMDGHSYIPTVIFLVLLLLSDSINGQSLGKWLFKIQVVDFKTQQPTGFVKSVIRNSVFLFNFLIIPAALNYILYVSYYRRLGDFLASTCVINKPQSV